MIAADDNRWDDAEMAAGSDAAEAFREERIQEFLNFCVETQRKTIHLEHPAVLLLSAVWTCMMLEKQRDEREQWDTIACAMFDFKDQFGWPATVAAIGKSMELYEAVKT